MTIEDPLPPKQPLDNPNVRPPLDINQVINQVKGIMVYIEIERRKKDEAGTIRS